MTDTTGFGPFVPFLTFAEPINPDNFLIRPGEKMTVTFVKTRLDALVLTVDAEGRLIHESFGVIPVAMKTLSQARERLVSQLTGIFNSKDIVVSIDSPRPITVQVFGAVARPGTYTLSNAQTVADAIDSAGGIQSGGSHRRVELRGGPKTITADLVRARSYAENQHNPYLYAGNQVFVPQRLPQTVGVGGAVKSPRQVELLGEETLEDIIMLAGGFSQNADQSAIYVGADRRPSPLERTEFAANDVVFVKSKAPLSTGEVIVAGEVVYPGLYTLQSPSTVASLLSQAGGLTEQANESRMVLFRQINGISGSGQRYAITANNQMRLQPNDSLVVPPLRGFVSVNGQVPRPGAFAYVPGKHLSFYLILAGLLDEERNVSYFLKDAISGQTNVAGRNSVVQDGDEIVVRKPE